MQNQLISSEVQKNLAEADATRSNTPFIGRRNEADIAATEANTEATKTKTDLDRVNILVANANLERIKQMTPLEMQLMQANAENVTANTSITKLQEKIQQWDLDHIKPLEAQELKARISQAYATIGYLVAQGRLSNAQAGLVAKMTLTEIAKEKGVRLDNMLKEDDYGRRETQFWTDMENKRAQTKYLNSQSDKTEDDNVRAWFGVVMDVFNTGMSMAGAAAGAPGAGAGASAAGSYGLKGGAVPKARSMMQPSGTFYPSYKSFGNKK